MTVVLRHSRSLNLNFVECIGEVTTDQLAALAACAAQNSELLGADSLNVVRPGADLSGVDMDALGVLFARYRKLYEPLRFQIYRRTAWVCECPAACAYVDFWVAGEASRKAFSTNARRLSSVAAACEWLLLSVPERAQVESGEGFAEFGRFEDAPLRAAAR